MMIALAIGVIACYAVWRLTEILPRWVEDWQWSKVYIEERDTGTLVEWPKDVVDLRGAQPTDQPRRH